MKKEQIQQRFNEVALELIARRNSLGFWEGKLSSSALGVAVAVVALHFDGLEKNLKEIHSGIAWLYKNINADGSFGDTPESPGNVSTSLLVYAALNLYTENNIRAKKTNSRISAYLLSKGIETNSPKVAEYILNHYQKDYTFSVPILAMCGLCNVPGENAFKHIPQLPFELSLLPRRFFKLLNLSVVSYAIPALVAVGIVIFKKKKSGIFWRVVRKFSIPRAMKILQRMLPMSGGFLEAIPLTAFVCLSLISSGFKETEVVEKGISFLKKTQREDGGWAIDIDLSTWVTSLSVKAFRASLNGFFTSDDLDSIADYYKLIQNQEVHPFNGTAPGGWGWTHFPGSVPDCDDTPGAMLALLKLQKPEEVKSELLDASRWLGEIQNKDGGFPTFSKGWGKLPFDQSCADLTGHVVLAVSAVIESFRNDPDFSTLKRLEKMFNAALIYLDKHQKKNGSWLPLWFGNQYTSDHTNPVYGTARVVTYLKDCLFHEWLGSDLRDKIELMVEKGNRFLISVQNEDGSWGGDKNIQGSMEETALAISALSSGQNWEVCMNGLNWLDHFYSEKGLKASPIGLYFASLWYDEELYPVTFYLEALGRILEIES
ncbi:MAG: hypothetical protein JXR31_16500 [Prolixibacteraceae bacterium]|nr:hypothetical protein [Prolixibacteraceae bacterium]